jgi:hypothetical protein
MKKILFVFILCLLVIPFLFAFNKKEQASIDFLTKRTLMLASMNMYLLMQAGVADAKIEVLNAKINHVDSKTMKALVKTMNENITKADKYGIIADKIHTLDININPVETFQKLFDELNNI